MFLWHFVIDYCNGLCASLRGFFVLHKLDTQGSAGPSKGGEPAPRKDAASAPTVLGVRRRLTAASDAAARPAVEEIDPQKPTGLKRVFQCMVLNVACVLALQAVLMVIRLIVWLTSFRVPDGWCSELVSSTLGALSILPVFCVTRLINALWFSDVANASLKYCGAQPAQPPYFSRAAADFVVSILVELVFLLQSMMMVHLPIPLIAPFITFFHLSLLYALYSFEYFWMSQGFELKSRLAKIERCWPYFMGFGTPLTVLTSLSNNFIVNGCIFGMFFPFFIISSYLADTKALSEQSSSIPTVHIFWPSLIITNRISAYISRLAEVRRPSGGPVRGTRLVGQPKGPTSVPSRPVAPSHTAPLHHSSRSPTIRASHASTSRKYVEGVYG